MPAAGQPTAGNTAASHMRRRHQHNTTQHTACCSGKHIETISVHMDATDSRSRAGSVRDMLACCLQLQVLDQCRHFLAYAPGLYAVSGKMKLQQCVPVSRERPNGPLLD